MDCGNREIVAIYLARRISFEQKARNAAALTAAVIREFKARGVSASHWNHQSPTPASGWLIRGVFSEQPPQGFGSSLTSLGSSAAPNTEVSVTITDLAANAAVATSNTYSHSPQRLKTRLTEAFILN